MHPVDGDRRLVEAEPEVIADAAIAAGVVDGALALHRASGAREDVDEFDFPLLDTHAPAQ